MMIIMMIILETLEDAYTLFMFLPIIVMLLQLHCFFHISLLHPTFDCVKRSSSSIVTLIRGKVFQISAVKIVKFVFQRKEKTNPC